MVSKIKYREIKGRPSPQEEVNRLSELINDVGYVNDTETIEIINEHVSYPVTSVNGQQGDIELDIPVVKRTETYLGSTDVNGNYSITYVTPYSSVPHLQPVLQSGTADQTVRIVSSTNTGFTVNVTVKTKTTVLGVEVVSMTNTPVNAASVSVLVAER